MGAFAIVERVVETVEGSDSILIIIVLART